MGRGGEKEAKGWALETMEIKDWVDCSLMKNKNQRVNKKEKMQLGLWKESLLVELSEA